MQPYYDQDGITIYHGDCRDVMPHLVSESFDCVWTDPPYGHKNQDGDLQSARVRDGVKGARKKDCVPIANDCSFDVVDSALTECERLLRKDCCCCCCCCGGGGPKPTFAKFANRMDTGGLQFFHAVVWDKTQRGPGLGWRFRRDYEFVMVAHRRGGKLMWGEESPAISNIQCVKPDRNELHPTMKPVGLIGRFLDVVSPRNVLDPFMGSGSTLLAAKLAGIFAVGIELEEKYCEIAANRLSQKVLF